MIRINLDNGDSAVISGVGVKGDVVVTNKNGRLTFKDVDGPNASKPQKPVGDVEFNVGRADSQRSSMRVQNKEKRDLEVKDFENDIGWVSKAVRDQFIANLNLVETKQARNNATKGITRCKLCAAHSGKSGKTIGEGSYYSVSDGNMEVTWPVELAEHFIRKHNCNPPSWFNRFINDLAYSLERKGKKSKTKNITKMKPKKAKDLSR